MLSHRNLLRALVVSLVLAASALTSRAQFKVIGYFPSWQGSVSAIQFSKLTHVNYAFLLPNANGSLQAIDNASKLQSLVTAAHNAGVKVSISVGGWNDGDDSAFVSLAGNSTSRTAFVNNIVSFINQYNLDGVDIDWEYPDTSSESSNYTTLMSQLATAMHTRGKLLTAAVIAEGSTADFISTSVFSSVDWLNLMNYDNNDFQHSTYSSAVSCLNYWITTRGLPASKAVQGVPFYSRPGYLSFAQLLANGANPNSDTFNGEGYNGLVTISNKTVLEFSRSSSGGMMMWELSLDATGGNSLLSAIDRVVKAHQTADFTIAASPSSRSLNAGGNTTFTVTITAVNGFTGTVNFSASGLPSGGSASFSPTTVNGSGTSTLTVTTTSSTPAGTSTLTLTGTSGSLSHSTNVTLTVTNPNISLFEAENLTVTTNGATVTLNSDAGASGGAWELFNSTATGQSITFTTPVVPAGTYSLDFLYKKNTTRGIHSVSVDGGASLGSVDQYASAVSFATISLGNVTFATATTHTIRLAVTGKNAASTGFTVSADAFRLTFQGAPTPDFSIAATPSSQTVTAGNGTSYTATITALNGFSGNVDLTVSGLPSGASASFNPTPIVGSGSSTMSVSTTTSTPGGTSTLTVTGTSGSLVHTSMVSLVVNAFVPPPTNFTLAVSPSSQTITAGGADVNYTVTSTATNFSSAVTLSISGLPAGATAVFGPNPITPPQPSTLTVSADASTVPGSYPFTVTGIGGGLTRTASGTLVVNGPPPAGILEEAEFIPRTSSGPAINIVADAGASAGNWVSLLASNTGPFIEYTLTNIPAGTYNLGLLYKQHPNRGIHNLSVDGVQIDGTLDQYNATASFQERAFGVVTFTAAGSHAVRLTVTGKNAAAGNQNISADAFRLTTTNEVFSSQDIGAVGLAGSFSQNGTTFTLAGSGADIWTTGDQFRYAYEYLSGDFEVVARVVSESGNGSFAKAGVMIRESLATNSVNAAVLLTPTNGVALQIRPTTGAASINVTGWVKGPTPPYWVRLARTGNTFTGFSSPNGSTWTQLGSTNVTMNGGVTAGMAVTSHNNAQINTAVFDAP